MLYVVDIDGVVADARQRLPLIEGNPPHPQWVRFFDAAADDPPLREGIEFVRDLACRGTVVWVTGRPERVRALTEQWLRQHGLPVDRLVMQKDDDYRPASIVKLEHLSALGGSGSIALIVDDDPRVIAAANEAGYPTILAEWCPWQPVTEPSTGATRQFTA